MKSDSRVQLNDVSYSYEEQAAPALSGVSALIQPGEFVAVLGHNGSGKSTMAKLLNALFVPTEGNVVVCGYNTREEKLVWEIRQRAGMIFQNPDNQIVATVVKEDVAFGLENLGVPTEEMIPRIESALSAVRMSAYADKAPHMLSGGQKQRVAIAGILAMEPSVIIADEATAMLDPSGRKEVLETIRTLNRQKGITVVDPEGNVVQGDGAESAAFGIAVGQVADFNGHSLSTSSASSSTVRIPGRRGMPASRSSPARAVI